MLNHQYVERNTRQVREERFYGDLAVRALYSPALERASLLTKLASSQWLSGALASLNYHTCLGSRATQMSEFLRRSDIDFSECLDSPEKLDTAEEIFQRKILFW